MFSEMDRVYMQRALALAERGLYTTTPNPRVGCVLVKMGQIIGEGYTQPAGAAHAEIRALREARLRGAQTRGATAYVSLEPCSHFGRTPPCTDALIDAGISEVVAAMQDPDPRVCGQGFAALRAAGISVRSGLLAQLAYELNVGFVSRIVRGRPWLRLKIAASLDGCTALPDGTSQWLTGEAARRDGHRWRARACAILSGIGTVLQDDPQLTVRAVSTGRQPIRVIVDSQLKIPLNARVLQGEASWIFCAAHPEGSAEFSAKIAALRARSIEVIALPNAQSQVDLPELLRVLAQRGINELHVEAGRRLNGALLATGCVDELLLYLAPMVLGDALGMFALPAPTVLTQAMKWSLLAVEQLGEDLCIRARTSQQQMQRN